jgi:methionyl-tRNA formyltransferase
MPQTHVIATSRGDFSSRAARLAELTGDTFHLINEKTALTREVLVALNPRYVLFPHWSYIIPAEIFEHFECVIFHMTDVPFGRGGSPLQNLIARGIYETKITALRCVQELDAGPVYMKRPFSLHGAAEEIYLRAAATIEQMIEEIVVTQPTPVPQTGEITTFQRRKPSESSITDKQTLREVFDYIRMLDAEGYPKAFIETNALRFEFSRASLQPNKILADVRITTK